MMFKLLTWMYQVRKKNTSVIKIKSTVKNQNDEENKDTVEEDAVLETERRACNKESGPCMWWAINKCYESCFSMEDLNN